MKKLKQFLSAVWASLALNGAMAQEAPQSPKVDAAQQAVQAAFDKALNMKYAWWWLIFKWTNWWITTSGVLANSNFWVGLRWDYLPRNNSTTLAGTVGGVNKNGVVYSATGWVNRLNDSEFGRVDAYTWAMEIMDTWTGINTTFEWFHTTDSRANSTTNTYNQWGYTVTEMTETYLKWMNGGSLNIGQKNLSNLSNNSTIGGNIGIFHTSWKNETGLNVWLNYQYKSDWYSVSVEWGTKYNSPYVNGKTSIHLWKNLSWDTWASYTWNAVNIANKQVYTALTWNYGGGVAKVWLNSILQWNLNDWGNNAQFVNKQRIAWTTQTLFLVPQSTGEDTSIGIIKLPEQIKLDDLFFSEQQKITITLNNPNIIDQSGRFTVTNSSKNGDIVHINFNIAGWNLTLTTNEYTTTWSWQFINNISIPINNGWVINIQVIVSE
jgi:hypothetical protein